MSKNHYQTTQKGSRLTVEVTVNSQDETAVVAPDPSVPGRYIIETTRTTTTVTRTSIDVAVTVSQPEPDPEPVPEMYLGMTALPGPEWDNCLSYYGASKIQAIRLFGKDNLYSPTDVDTLTEWQKWNTEKWTGADKRALAVLSVKDDTDEYLDAWAATFPPPAELAALGFPGTAVSPWHEPEDNVRGGEFSWAQFRQSGVDIVSWRNRHPRGKELIRWVGPCLTKWDLVNLNNDPRNAGFEGMNMYMFDTYQASPNDGRYATPAELLDEPIARIHAHYPGIEIGIPEFGMALQNNDPTKSGWVVAHRTLVAAMRTNPFIRFAIAFNSVGSMPEVPFYTSGPVAALYRDELLRPFA